MAIRTWHVGKLVLLWAWAAVLGGLLLQVIKALPPNQFVIGFTLIGVFIGIALIMSVITWKWLGGKEQ